VPDTADDDALLALVALRRSDTESPGWTRRRRGRGFSYHDVDGGLLRGPDRDRAAALVLPPAWERVWISPDPDGHLQASGFDAADRRQYRYHERWVEGRRLANLDRMAAIGVQLGPLRRRLDELIVDDTDPRRQATAAMVRLVDGGLARIGGLRSAREMGHHGVSTLRQEHVEIDEGEVHLSYVGKAGVEHDIVVEDPLLADVLEGLEDEGDELFVLQTADGPQRLTALDANRLLAELTGGALTCKDFRTWGGTAVALEARAEGADPIAAVDAAAEALGNTRTVARSSYVHPAVLVDDPEEVRAAWRGARSSIRYDRRERALLRLLDRCHPLLDRWVETLDAAERTAAAA
jgi:DNA topoisomerase I